MNFKIYSSRKEFLKSKISLLKRYSLIWVAKIPLFLFPLLYKNFFIKVFSLVAAITLSVYVDLQNRIEKVIRVPLSIKDIPAHLGLQQSLPQSLFLTVFGRRTDLERLESEKMGAVVSLSSFKKNGEYVVFPTLKGTLPSGVRFERLSPDRFTVILSQTRFRHIRVEPEFINEPKDNIGFSYTIKPNRVRIVGPEDIIKNILILRTEPIDLSLMKGKIDAAFEFKVKISKSTTEHIRFDREREYAVNVVRDSKYILKKLSEPIPISLQDLDQSLQVITQNPLYVSGVEVNLPKQRRGSFNPYKDVTFFIDLDDIKLPGEYTVSIEYQVAEGIQIRSFTPKVVKITVDFPPVVAPTSAPPEEDDGPEIDFTPPEDDGKKST